MLRRILKARLMIKVALLFGLLFAACTLISYAIVFFHGANDQRGEDFAWLAAFALMWLAHFVGMPGGSFIIMVLIASLINGCLGFVIGLVPGIFLDCYLIHLKEEREYKKNHSGL
jgi:hypothetical protein